MKDWKKYQNLTVVRLVQLILFLYIFLVSIALMGASMKMFGKGFAETLIANTSNPMVGLFIGILATSLIQSSSSTTSIVVGMVGSGVMNVANAIPIIMGANIGTSVTNTLVSLAHVNRSEEFRRSFAASTVHDFFNFMAVLIIFPLQYFFNVLGFIADNLGSVFQNVGGLKFFNPLKEATKPAVKYILNLLGDHPAIALVIAMILLFFSLKMIVDALRILVVQKAERWFDKVLFKTAMRAFTVGLILTIFAQSSSITTSLIVPMAGAGVLTLVQIFPYTLGANIGTTFTAMLASLATGNISAVVVAFAHLTFNVIGILFVYPMKQAPLFLAKKIADIAVGNKLIPFAYIVIMFFIIPLIVVVLFR